MYPHKLIGAVVTTLLFTISATTYASCGSTVNICVFNALNNSVTVSASGAPTAGKAWTSQTITAGQSASQNLGQGNAQPTGTLQISSNGSTSTVGYKCTNQGVGDRCYCEPDGSTVINNNPANGQYLYVTGTASKSGAYTSIAICADAQCGNPSVKGKSCD